MLGVLAFRLLTFIARRADAVSLGEAWFPAAHPKMHYFWLDLPRLTACAGVAVVAAWATALAAEGPRPRADWVEVALRGCGAAWIALWAYFQVLARLW